MTPVIRMPHFLSRCLSWKTGSMAGFPIRECDYPVPAPGESRASLQVSGV
jgi:hypothetical protein